MCMHSRRIYIFLFILIISDSPLSKTHLLVEILRWNIKLILLLFNVMILINYIYHRGIFLNIALNLFFILRYFILILIFRRLKIVLNIFKCLWVAKNRRKLNWIFLRCKLILAIQVFKPFIRIEFSLSILI
jgi:hypothetical protein